MRPAIKSFLMLSVVLILASVFYLLHFKRVLEPELPGVLTNSEISWEGYARNYTYYTPSRLSAKPGLVFVFHGSGGNADRSRAMYGYGFDRLAEDYGFMVVYPEGYKNHYNGCRKQGPYEANRLKIDDVGFIRVLVDRFVEEYQINPKAVFATGISNGGQMALRLALEAPELVAAVASVATSIPTDDNMDCVPSGEPVAFLLMNGTGDPMNPYAGGNVALYGLIGDRGDVISSTATVAYWATLAGHTKDPEKIMLPDKVLEDDSTVEINLWRAQGRKSVALYSIIGGGHNAPHPEMKVPRLLGSTNQDFIAAEEIWAFFLRATLE
jgi:polyhydroxybutyrate depolymerase